MKFNEKYKINPEFAGLFKGLTHEDNIGINAQNISARFLNEIEKLCDERGLLRKDLAKDLGTSASYITQLFRGDKLLNINFISKVEDYFKISFEVKTKSIVDGMSKADLDVFNSIALSNPQESRRIWVCLNFKGNDTPSQPVVNKKSVPSNPIAA